MKNAVVHFEIPAHDLMRAKKFYEDVFGWKMEQWGDKPYIMVTCTTDGSGINGGIAPRTGAFEKGSGASGAVLTVQIHGEKLGDYIAKVKAAGGKLVREAMDIEGVGQQCFCSDTEGNIFGILEGTDHEM